MQEKLKTFLLSNQAKTIYWSFANLLILLAIGAVSETGFYPMLLLPILNLITKEINKRYLTK